MASNGLHGVVPQKIEISLTTAVRTSNPTQSIINANVIHVHDMARR
jgi:hypothetical protein